MVEVVVCPKSIRHPSLLVVDDDREIRELLSSLLSRRGYKVSTAREEHEMHRILSSSRIDLVILDLMLPGKDGLAICRELRATKSIPIIMLTARGDPTDRIIGLEIGADDYLPKPFDVRELEARIKAVLRRSPAEISHPSANIETTYAFEGWTLKARQRQLLAPDGAIVDLTSGEFVLSSSCFRGKTPTSLNPRSVVRSRSRTRCDAIRSQHRCHSQPLASQN